MEMHKLTEQEQRGLRALRASITAAKERIFDLNAALESAQRDLLAAQSREQGACSLLMEQLGWKQAELSSDCGTMTRKE